MEKDSSQDPKTEQQFWDELRNLLSQPCTTHESIDDTLRAYLDHSIESKGEHVSSEYDIARCSYTLISSPLFASHGGYVRKQIIFGLLQDDEPDVLHFAASFLLFDGKVNESTFETMNNEGAFARLINLISSPEVQEDAGLHRLLMDLLYEMGRLQKIHADDLMQVDDNFIKGLFQIIEELSDDVNDPYHYPVIRLLLVLNEQFMVSAHDPDTSGKPAIPLTNKVIKILSSQGSRYKTFGENIILLLNRESETSLQLLTLKLLYLLFTTPSTYEYFYTNDLRVLVDILIRNLLDLPEDASALRHTYLRVLYPLLAHTQLRNPPHYKREELKKLLSLLVRGSVIDEEAEDHEGRMQYFEEVDQTTKRLVTRCGKVAWLQDEDAESTTSPVEDSKTTSPIEKPPPPTPRKLKKRNSSKSSVSSSNLTVPSAVPGHLGMGLDSANGSSLSVFEVAAHKEKPGVITPSRKDFTKSRPEPPKARRSGWAKKKPDEEVESKHDTDAKTTSYDNTHQHDEEEDEDHSATTTVHNSPLSPSHVKAFREKKPPPMPKARRWRGIPIATNTKEGGNADSKSSDHPRPPPKDDIHQVSPPSSSSPSPSFPPPPPPIPLPVPVPSQDTPHAKGKSSVSAALSEAQAEAVEGVTETLERSRITPPRNHTTVAATAGAPPPAPPEAIATNDGPDAAAVSKGVPPIILAPPAPAPPRGVRGPEFRVETTLIMPPVAEEQQELSRSPFEGGESEEDDFERWE